LNKDRYSSMIYKSLTRNMFIFYLRDVEKLTFEQIGIRFLLTRERIRQIVLRCRRQVNEGIYIACPNCHQRKRINLYLLGGAAFSTKCSGCNAENIFNRARIDVELERDRVNTIYQIVKQYHIPLQFISAAILEECSLQRFFQFVRDVQGRGRK